VTQEVVLASREDPPLVWSGCHSSTWQALSHLYERFSLESNGSVRRFIARVNSISGILSLPRGYRFAWLRAIGRLILTIRDSPMTLMVEHRVTSLATTLISTGNSGAKQPSRQFHEAVFLVFLWILARSFKASNPRDYIYGVLGMADGLTHTVLPIDYSKSLREVYLDATVVILNAGCISALHTMLYAFPMIGTNCCHDNHQTGPSWVFDFSYKGMEWAESLLNEESWALRGYNASRYAVGEDGIGLRLSSGQLVVCTSMVDEMHNRLPAAAEV
jgi:hypothetical protein